MDDQEFSPEKFFELASQCEKEISRLKKEAESGPGKPQPAGVFELEMEMDRALKCALWMEKTGQTSARFVGPFGSMPFKKNNRVRIKAGARIYSTYPGWPEEGKVLTRSLVVKVDHTYSGYLREDRVDSQVERYIENPMVNWAGTGGYWKRVDANFCDLVEETATAE